MSWNSQRQLIYGSAVLLFLILVIGIPVYNVFFNKAPSCFDNKLNQNETGVDCGGMCERACVLDVVSLPVTVWSRAFLVTEGMYNLVAYVQNPNVEYVAEPTRYIFRVYDKDNVLIGVREGTADVPPTKTFPIFEQGFDTGYREPVSTFFSFIRSVPWKKYQGSLPELEIADERITEASTGVRIDAVLINKTINQYMQIEVVAIVYDAEGNAMASSRTFVEKLEGSASAPLVFTWPKEFPSEVSKIEIIPKLPISLTL